MTDPIIPDTAIDSYLRRRFARLAVAPADHDAWIAAMYRDEREGLRADLAGAYRHMAALALRRAADDIEADPPVFLLPDGVTPEPRFAAGVRAVINRMRLRADALEPP